MLFLFVLHYFGGINKITLKKRCVRARVCVRFENELPLAPAATVFYRDFSLMVQDWSLIFLFFISVTRMSKSMITSNPHIRLHAGYNNSEI